MRSRNGAAGMDRRSIVAASAKSTGWTGCMPLKSASTSLRQRSKRGSAIPGGLSSPRSSVVRQKA